MGESVWAGIPWAINDILAGIDPSSTSNNKWRPLESYIGELAEIEPDGVYTTYISKAGNATVRFDQSPRARQAPILVGLLDPPLFEDPERTVEALLRYCARHRQDAEIFLILKAPPPPHPDAPPASDGRQVWYPYAHIRRADRQTKLSPVISSLPMRIDVFMPDDPTVVPPLRFLVVDHPGEAPRDYYPSVVLQRDYWDDFGYKTLFSMVYRRNPADQVELGELKIIRRDQHSGPVRMPGGLFDALGQEYCSLGQGYSYYENLRKLPRQVYRIILKGLRDVVFDSRVRLAFQDLPDFETSLMRTGGAARALEDAPSLFASPREAKNQRGLNFRFRTSVGGNRFRIDFSFNQSAKLPDRINAIIGYNGTGKTQLLANLAVVSTGDMSQRARFIEHGEIEDSKAVRFSKVIAISYSAFDTFVLPDAFWRQEEAVLARKRLKQKGEVFGYAYCGLRKRTDDQPLDTRELRGLKSIDELTEEFALALEMAQNGESREVFSDVLSIISSEPSFGRTGLLSYTSMSDDDWRGHFRLLSTGHKIVLNILAQVVGHSEPKSLVLIDEPESHLHPSLLAALLRALNVALRGTDSYAILATHSPVVLQEIPRRYVRILQRYGEKTRVFEPLSETFGENVGYLTSNVFHLDSTQTDYHSVLDGLAGEMTLEEIEGLFDYEMSAQARAYVLGLLDRRRR